MDNYSKSVDNYAKPVDNSIKPRLQPVDNYVNKPLNQSNFATVLISLAVWHMGLLGYRGLYLILGITILLLTSPEFSDMMYI